MSRRPSKVVPLLSSLLLSFGFVAACADGTLPASKSPADPSNASAPEGVYAPAGAFAATPASSTTGATPNATDPHAGHAMPPQPAASSSAQLPKGSKP